MGTKMKSVLLFCLGSVLFLTYLVGVIYVAVESASFLIGLGLAPLTAEFIPVALLSLVTFIILFSLADAFGWVGMDSED